MQTLKTKAEENVPIKPASVGHDGHFDDKTSAKIPLGDNVNENSIVDEMPTKRSAEIAKASEQVSMAEEVYDEDDFELEQDQTNL